jgi:PAS domain S-box-containing protein
MEPEREQVRIRTLLKEHPKGLTIEEVSKKLSLNRATAAKYLNSMMIAGQAEMREFGRAKVFYLSQRLPLTNLLSLSSDLILILDRDLFIQEVNEPFLAFFHQTKDELKGKKIEHSAIAFWFPETRIASLNRALEGTEVTHEVHFEVGDADRYFRMKLIPVVFESGSHAVGIILEDISEMKRYQLELEEGIRERTAKLQVEVEQHKRAEVALRENEAVLRSMLDATPVGVGLLVDRVFKKVNNSLCDMTGYSVEDLTGRNSRFLYPDNEEYNRISRELYKPVDGNGVGMLESRIRRKDGAIIDVIISLSPFDSQNPGAGVTATIMDVTERKRAEDALRRAGNEVALLTSITRHDILNKLTALRGYIRYMKRMEINETLAGIVGKEEHVAEQIAKLINFTRDYKDVGVQPPAWTGIAATIRTIRQSMDLRAVTLDTDTDGVEVYADPLILKVFSSLIDNSLQSVGAVTEIRITARESGDCLTILYEDNGTGIPVSEKEMIFDREYETTTGIRLFLAREILAITSITITENGEPGSGTRFEMTVPKGDYRFTAPL